MYSVADITEEKRLRMEQQARELRYRALIDASPHGVQECNFDGTITFRALQQEKLFLHKRMLQDVDSDLTVFNKILTINVKMRSIFNYIKAISISKETVLITGESGVGKELFAEAIHQTSRKDDPWVIVNVAGLDDNMFADTLFGHIKGAFTGADQNRPGMIEQAGEGTLFLDEIGDLSLFSQVKLLRFLQSGEYYPVGSDRLKKSLARLVFATNQDLTEKQKIGQFRKDLYFRLKIHLIEIPPLRERKKDIPLLLDYFLNEASDMLNKKRPTPPPELADLLATYDFPGNVRELRAMVYNAVSVHVSRKLSMKSFKRAIGHSIAPAPLEIEASLTFGPKLPTLKTATNQLVKEALRRSAGNQTIAAGLLGIAQSSLNRRLKKMNRD
jgi:transcriptional regulator with PAS, ATPase and Fis domain